MGQCVTINVGNEGAVAPADASGGGGGTGFPYHRMQCSQ